jgi:hypothetical protein
MQFCQRSVISRMREQRRESRWQSRSSLCGFIERRTVTVQRRHPLIPACVCSPNRGCIADELTRHAGASPEHRRRDHAAFPKLLQELAFGYHAMPVPNEIEEEFEYPRLKVDHESVATGRESVAVKL